MDQRASGQPRCGNAHLDHNALRRGQLDTNDSGEVTTGEQDLADLGPKMVAAPGIELALIDCVAVTEHGTILIDIRERPRRILKLNISDHRIGITRWAR